MDTVAFLVAAVVLVVIAFLPFSGGYMTMASYFVFVFRFLFSAGAVACLELYPAPVY
jgi:hypothetical protein